MTVAVDGEIVRLQTPLRLGVERGALTAIVPRSATDCGGERAPPAPCPAPDRSA